MPKFKVGDKVRVIKGQHPFDYFPDEAIYKGQSSREPTCVALQRLDNVEGSAQNGWWNFRERDLKYLELVKLISKPITETMIKLAKKDKAIEMEVYRKNGQTIFKFEIQPEIEELYKKNKPEIKTSESWTGLKFYYLPHIIEQPAYKEKLRQFSLFDDFGVGFYKDKKLNIAWLRTVGGKGEIEVKDLVPFAEFSYLLKGMTQFLKEYYEDFFKEFSLKGHLTLEI